MGLTAERDCDEHGHQFHLSAAVALLLLDVQTKRGFRPAQVFIIIVGLIALLALIGYGYRVLPLYSFGSQMPMALNSAICFELFAWRRCQCGRDRGVMMVITSDTTGGAHGAAIVAGGRF